MQKEKTRKEKSNDWKCYLSLYTHKSNDMIYMQKPNENMQGFCKRMLNWKFRMSCRYNRCQTPRRVVDKSTANFQRKHSK